MVVRVVEVRKVSQIGRSCRFGIVWYELNIVNQLINQSMTEVGIELLGQLKINKTFE